MNYQKRKLISIAKKATSNKPLQPDEINYLLAFEKINQDSTATKFLKRIAAVVWIFVYSIPCGI